MSNIDPGQTDLQLCTAAGSAQDAPPRTCTLMGAAWRTRREEVRHVLQHGVLEVQELADGYALRFTGDDAWAATLVAFITGERRCCTFFRFELVFEPDHGPIWLRLRGGAGVKAFLRDELLAAGTSGLAY